MRSKNKRLILCPIRGILCIYKDGKGIEATIFCNGLPVSPKTSMFKNQEVAKAKAMEFYDYDVVKFEFGVAEIYEISEETNG